MNNLQRINYLTGEKNSKIIKVLTDSSCNMQAVMNDKECIMEGNYWDFHPGCHGIYKYGDFKSASELAKQLKKYYEKDGYIVTIEYKDYKF